MHFWTVGRKKTQTLQAIFPIVPSSKLENISNINKKRNKTGAMNFKEEIWKEKSSNAMIINQYLFLSFSAFVKWVEYETS